MVPGCTKHRPAVLLQPSPTQQKVHSKSRVDTNFGLAWSPIVQKSLRALFESDASLGCSPGTTWVHCCRLMQPISMSRAPVVMVNPLDIRQLAGGAGFDVKSPQPLAANFLLTGLAGTAPQGAERCVRWRVAALADTTVTATKISSIGSQSPVGNFTVPVPANTARWPDGQPLAIFAHFSGLRVQAQFGGVNGRYGKGEVDCCRSP